MGDDIPDYVSMQMAGLACCPADAATEIKQISQYISPLNGGYGCARDVIEKVLKLNDHWDLNTGLAWVRSISGAPAKMKTKDGRNVNQTVAASPIVAASIDPPKV